MSDMLKVLVCAVAFLPGPTLVGSTLAGSTVIGSTLANAGEMAMPVKGFLCDTADHALQFADIRAKGETEEIAKDRVGRSAGAEVCGRYVGIAVIQSEQVSLQGGIAYRITAFRFPRDQRVVWLAERSFAPTNTQWAL